MVTLDRLNIFNFFFDTILKKCLVIPVTICASERSFSKVESKLPSTMTNETVFIDTGDSIVL